MATRIDLLAIGQWIQVIDPSPRVNINDPLPALSIAAQYALRGPHRSSNTLFGRIGVSPTVACTLGSAPNFTKAREEVWVGNEYGIASTHE